MSAHAAFNPNIFTTVTDLYGEFIFCIPLNLRMFLKIYFLYLYYSEIETLVRKNICVLMFIVALGKIAWKWEQPKYPTTCESIKNFSYMDITEYYAVTRANEIT